MTYCPSMDQWHKGAIGGSRGPMLFGFAVIALWIGGFGIWATHAPIDGAVVTQGTFVATGQNKLVQHLEGGILKEVLVREGDRVRADQIVARIDDTATISKLRRLTQRMRRLKAVQARLEAEIKGHEVLQFPVDLVTEAGDPEVRDVLDRQRLEFEARRKKQAGDTEVLRREILGLEETLNGLFAQLDAVDKQTKLFQSELKDKEGLLDKTLVRRSDVLALKRAEARSVGDGGQISSRVGDVKERIARAEQQIAQIGSAALQRAIEELRAVETEIDDMREQILAARDVVERANVRSPVDGIVVKLTQTTRGGIVAAGAAILELLPAHEELVIEARVNPVDVVHVKADQPALIRLSSANQRIVPFIDGKVVYVSADAVAETDPRRVAGGGAFVVRVQIADPALSAKTVDFVPMPGMPADVFIKTGERTFMAYVVKPVTDSFSRAFREQ